MVTIKGVKAAAAESHSCNPNGSGLRLYIYVNKRTGEIHQDLCAGYSQTYWYDPDIIFAVCYTRPATMKKIRQACLDAIERDAAKQW